ncbi:hypothetical protein GALL_476860 [mine drainage metagenome]|uniref:Uncharacterized protein n=1 Tax=mine drainage metagenome TaxID=410659 RepID=A0A1J5PSX4_9ZZZZ
MPARRGDFEGALGGGLAFHLAQVRSARWLNERQRLGQWQRRRTVCAAGGLGGQQGGDHVEQMTGLMNLQAADQRGLAGAEVRQDQRPWFGLAFEGQRHRQRAAYRA